MSKEARQSVTLKNRFRRFGRGLVDFAFPPSCGSCGDTDPHAFDAEKAGGSQFCSECYESLCPEIPYFCDRCGAATGPFTTTSGSCVHCRGRSLRFESVACLAMYEGVVRSTVLAAKWNHSATALRALSRMLARRKNDEFAAMQPDLIIPIPQHWQQRLTRHFNPAAVVAAELARCLRLRCDDRILRRRRRARLQKRVAVSKRFENQAGTFGVVDAHVLRGKRVLLVDDVLTTGATCSEAAHCLRSAGSGLVHAAVLARVLDHSA